MLGTRRKFRARRFDIQHPSEVALFESIKEKALLKREPGWVIISQTQTSNKDGDVFIMLEWTEPDRGGEL